MCIDERLTSQEPSTQASVPKTTKELHWRVTPKGFPIYDNLGVDYAKSYEDLVLDEHN